MAGPGKGGFLKIFTRDKHYKGQTSNLQKSSTKSDNPQKHHHVHHKGQTSKMQLQDEELFLDDTMQPHDVPQRRHVLKKGQTSNFQNQYQDFPINDTMQSRDVSSRQRHVLKKGQTSKMQLRVEEEDVETSLSMENHDDQEEEEEVDSVQMEEDPNNTRKEYNIGSTSHGTSDTRKESRILIETKKRHTNKGKLTFQVDETAGRLIGEDSQQLITKGGCVMREYAKFDGTTWKKQPELLKIDIMSKCTENSTYDPSCRLMVRALDTQLANQHKNRQYRLHLRYKKFSSKVEAINHPPNGIKVPDWVKLCERFASEEFQNTSTKNQKNRAFNEVPPAVGTVSIARIVDKRRRDGEEVTAIDQYKIGHFSKKKNKMVNEKADEILRELQSEEADSLCSPMEICLKKLHYIPGHLKGRAAPRKQILATENLRMELELERKRSNALEEEIQVIKEEQSKYQEEQSQYQSQMNEQMRFMMEELSRLSKLQSQKN